MQGGRDEARKQTTLSPTSGEAGRLTQAMPTALASDSSAALNTGAPGAIYNTREPVQALANMASMTVEAVFILKDFHRHLDDPVVVRRLRDVGQKFSVNRRTVIITAPILSVPPELASLVEYVELPLPDNIRLRQLIDDTMQRMGQTRTLRHTLDSSGLDRMVNNLRGL